MPSTPCPSPIAGRSIAPRSLPPPLGGAGGLTTDTERALAELWRGLLDLDAVGRDDDFVAVGGHSILAVRLVAAVRRRWGAALGLTDVFRYPTLGGFAAEIDRRAGRADAPQRTATRTGPVTSAQRHLWFLDRLRPGSPHYTIAEAFRLRGPLDVDRLRRALAAVVERHEALRTRIVQADDGELEQVVEPPSTGMLRVAAVPADQLTALLRLDASRPFDIDQGPPLRATLAQVGPEDHALLLAIHHTAADGWSLPTLYADLAHAYRAAAEESMPALSTAPLRPIDYARWQREQAARPERAEHAAYWRSALAGAPPVLPHPTDRPRTAQAATAGSRLSTAYAHDLGRALDAFCQREGVTPFVAAFTAYVGLLARRGGHADRVVGVNASDRERAGAEDAVGLYVNLVPVRTSFTPERPWRESLASVRDAVFRALDHAEVPFDQIVEAVGPRRVPGADPIVQTLFSLDDARDHRLALTAVEAEPIPLDLGAATHDLVFDLVRDGDQLGGRLEYRTDLYELSTAREFVREYETVLTDLLTSPERPPAPEPPVAEADDAAGPSTLHGMVGVQAAATPLATAVVAPDGDLTYADLDARAVQLARHLRARGVGRETRVALVLERSADAIVAILATLKAGGTYVPVDPGYPPARIAYILADADASVVVTQGALPVDVPEGVAVVDLGADALDPAAAGPVDDLSSADSAAYVIYTSGSTGAPKGVVVEHRQAVHSTTARAAVYGGPVGSYLLLPSLAFDSSVAGLFWTLSTGGTLVIPGPDAAADLAALSRLVASYGVTHVLGVPSLYGLLLDHSVRLGSLRTCVVAGEACPAGLVDRHAERLPGARLFNEYGPTEASVWCTVYDTAAWGADRQRAATVPIGRAIPGVQVDVVGAHGRPLSAGETGEIWVSGRGVARGYLGRPDLTAERFVVTPDGRRAYRTGDRGRALDDGTLLFLGRDDGQVSLRGYRVELGEVEAVLSQHPAVAAVAAAVREGPDETPRLVAAVVAAEEHEVPHDALSGLLRAHAGRHLPRYMVPDAISVVEALPRTPNGKVDRGALPVGPVRTPPMDEHIAARSATEARLAEVWARVLGVDRVGIHDNFFESGGHSLLAVKLFAQIEAAFGSAPPLASLFSAPTTAQLAPLLDPTDTPPDVDDLGSALLPLQPDGAGPPLFCLHTAWNELLVYHPLAEALAPDQPVYYMRGQGRDGRPITHASVAEMVCEYVEAIRAVRPEGPYLLLGYCIGGRLAVEVARALRAGGAEVPLVIVVETPLAPPLPTRWDKYRSAIVRAIRRSDGGGDPRALIRWARRGLAHWVRRGRNALGPTAARGLAEAGATVPESVRQSYITDTYLRILYDRNLAPHPGRLLLIRSPESDDFHADWEALTEGPFETASVSGYRLLDDPAVAEVAGHVRAGIGRALQSS